MIFLFNAPPSAGKDTVSDWLYNHYTTQSSIELANKLPPLRARFSKHLKLQTHVDYGLYDKNNVIRAFDFYEKVKDLPNDDFFGLTPRRAYIDKSENRIKPFFGVGYYGEILCRTDLSNYQGENVFVSDSGFVEEAWPIGAAYGFDELTQIQIHRPGCDFSNDSRSYWSDPCIRQIIIENDSDLPNLFMKALNIVEKYQT